MQQYTVGDCMPHWGDLTIGQRLELTRLDTKKHHTICPDCRDAIRERDTRLGKEGPSYAKASEGRGDE